MKWVLTICMSVSSLLNLFAQEIPPQTLIIFGATGDLTKRGLVPALVRLAEKNKLPELFACIGVGLGPEDLDLYRSDLAYFLSPEQKTLWNPLSEKFHFIPGHFEHDKTYEKLSQLLKTLPGEKVFYLAIPPSYFSLVIEQLHKHKLLQETIAPVRVVIEKPFGLDLPSALKLQETLSQSLSEHQIYRMDHFLGIGIIQQLSQLRFSNPLIESIWNRNHIDSISITITQEMGIGGRGHFWEQTGYLRDVVQNHMMLLVSLIGMEKPDSLSTQQEERSRLLAAIRPIDQTTSFVRRGQYASGFIRGEPTLGYREESHVPPDSDRETAIAAKLFIDNEHWQGVPFYLKGGKRLQEDRFEIAVNFGSGNQLICQIEPKQEITLSLNLGSTLHYLTIPITNTESCSMPGAYEFLLSEVMQANPTHFVSFEEIAASWALFSPVFDSWKITHDLIEYKAGSAGPAFP